MLKRAVGIILSIAIVATIVLAILYSGSSAGLKTPAHERPDSLQTIVHSDTLKNDSI